MKTYKPKSTVTVRAGKIVKFNTHTPATAFPGFKPNSRAVLDDGSEHVITPEMTSRMDPAIGDYLVFAPNPDGATDYVYLNPRAVFEAKYEEVDGADKYLAERSRDMAHQPYHQQHNPRETSPDNKPKPVTCDEHDDRVRPPKQGEIVAYHHPGSLDGRYPPQISPAIVQQVTDDKASPLRCHLFVFGSKGQHMDWCEYGQGPSQWTYR